MCLSTITKRSDLRCKEGIGWKIYKKASDYTTANPKLRYWIHQHYNKDGGLEYHIPFGRWIKADTSKKIGHYQPSSVNPKIEYNTSWRFEEENTGYPSGFHVFTKRPVKGLINPGEVLVQVKYRKARTEGTQEWDNKESTVSRELPVIVCDEILVIKPAVKTAAAKRRK